VAGTCAPAAQRLYQPNTWVATNNARRRSDMAEATYEEICVLIEGGWLTMPELSRLLEHMEEAA